MINPFVSLGIIVIVAILTGCTDKDDVLVGAMDPISRCDTWKNDIGRRPGPPWVDGVPVPAVYWAYNGTISPSRDYCAYLLHDADYANTERRQPYYGLMVRELRTNKTHTFLEGFVGEYCWSKTTDVLYMLIDGSLVVLDLHARSSKTYPNIGYYERISVPRSGSSVFLVGYNRRGGPYGLYKWSGQADSAEYVTDIEILRSSVAENDSVLYSMYLSDNNSRWEKGFYTYNTRSNVLHRYDIAYDLNDFSGMRTPCELSPDGDKVLIEPVLRVNDYADNTNAGIWTHEISSGKLVRVLEPHPTYLFKRKNPKWSSRCTFTADWLCVRDSSVTINEYSLSGRRIKQVTLGRAFK